MSQEQVKPLKPQTNKQPEKELTPIHATVPHPQKKIHREQNKWMSNQRPELCFLLNLIFLNHVFE